MRNFYGDGKTRSYFEGWYCKHQKGGEILALIPGIQMDARGNRSAFIQVITNRESFYAEYPFSSFHACRERFSIQIGENLFSRRGIRLNIQTPELSLRGGVRYGPLHPIRTPIMGPFAAIPFLECNHGILSMSHSLLGTLFLNGRAMDFSGGQGYLEKDWGSSFPRSYLWAQCLFPEEDCSVIASVARIPLLGLRFPGCICSVQDRGREYRIATYLGGKAEVCTERLLLLRQGRLRLRVDLRPKAAQKLKAPARGGMTRSIHENASCPARFRFWAGGKLLFDLRSLSAGMEFVDAPAEHAGGAWGN